MSARFLTQATLLLATALAACTQVAAPPQPANNVIGGDRFLCDGKAAPCEVHLLGVEWDGEHCKIKIDHETLFVDPDAKNVDIFWSIDPSTGNEMQADSIELKDTSRYANFEDRYPIHDEQSDSRPMHRFHWRAQNVEHKGGNSYPYQIVLYDRAHENRRCVGDPIVVSPGRP